VLEIRDLAAIRGERLVFDSLSFRLGAGEAMAVIGRNGAGKTTLLRMIAGLTPPFAGGIYWCGEDTRTDPGAHQLRLAYISHQDAVKPGMTVAENLAAWAPGNPAVRSAAIERALAATGLEDLAHIPARLLSAGQKRRLALSRLALRPTALWILDEPATGLDDASLDRLGAMIAAHRADGGIVIAATHQSLPMPAAQALRLG
jgi:heme exporter protein A